MKVYRSVDLQEQGWAAWPQKVKIDLLIVVGVGVTEAVS